MGDVGAFGCTFASCPCQPWVVFLPTVSAAGAEQLLVAPCPGLAPGDLRSGGCGDCEGLMAFWYLGRWLGPSQL